MTYPMPDYKWKVVRRPKVDHLWMLTCRETGTTTYHAHLGDAWGRISVARMRWRDNKGHKDVLAGLKGTHEAMLGPKFALRRI